MHATTSTLFVYALAASSLSLFFAFLFNLPRPTSTHQTGQNNIPHIWSTWYFGPPQWSLSTYRFVYDSARRYGGLFKFRFRNTDVYFVSGHRWRQAVFHNRHMDLQQGMKLISVHAKQLVHPNSDEKSTSAWISKMLTRSSHLQEVLPDLIAELTHHAAELPLNGRVDLFEDFQLRTFRLVLRLFGPLELSADTDSVKALIRELNGMEVATSLSSTLLPSIPTPARMVRAWNILSMYRRLSKVINKRRESGARENDGLQIMLDHGYSNKDIIITLIGAYVVSMLNTDIILSWTFVYLFAHRDEQPYLSHTLTEISAFTSQHRAIFASPPTAIPTTLLSTLEDPTTFPTLDASLSETPRVRSASVAVFRRNISSGPVEVDGVSVPSGAFVLYPVADAHSEQGVWGESDVERFDPGRFMREGILKNTIGAEFLGFGSGFHACTGRRIARLLMKLCSLFILSQYDVELTDKNDVPLTSEPSSTPMLFRLSRPDEKEVVMLKLKKKVLVG